MGQASAQTHTHTHLPACGLSSITLARGSFSSSSRDFSKWHNQEQKAIPAWRGHALERLAPPPHQGPTGGLRLIITRLGVGDGAGKVTIEAYGHYPNSPVERRNCCLSSCGPPPPKRKKKNVFPGCKAASLISCPWIVPSKNIHNTGAVICTSFICVTSLWRVNKKTHGLEESCDTIALKWYKRRGKKKTFTLKIHSCLNKQNSFRPLPQEA